jgi:hypothetical protein
MSIDKGKSANFNIRNLKTHYEINLRQQALKFKNGWNSRKSEPKEKRVLNHLLDSPRRLE